MIDFQDSTAQFDHISQSQRIAYQPAAARFEDRDGKITDEGYSLVLKFSHQVFQQNCISGSVSGNFIYSMGGQIVYVFDGSHVIQVGGCNAAAGIEQVNLRISRDGQITIHINGGIENISLGQRRACIAQRVRDFRRTDQSIQCVEEYILCFPTNSVERQGNANPVALIARCSRHCRDELRGIPGNDGEITTVQCGNCTSCDVGIGL